MRIKELEPSFGGAGKMPALRYAKFIFLGNTPMGISQEKV
jgi:hypothetical protein